MSRRLETRELSGFSSLGGIRVLGVSRPGRYPHGPPSMPPVCGTKGRGNMKEEKVGVEIEIADLEQPSAPVAHMPAHSKHRSRP